MKRKTVLTVFLILGLIAFLNFFNLKKGVGILIFIGFLIVLLDLVVLDLVVLTVTTLGFIGLNG